MERLKKEFLLTVQKHCTLVADSKNPMHPNPSKNFWREMKGEMTRIQNTGVKVGNFHQMERESTPNFIDFVVKQVVSLLVTFRR